MTDGPVLAIRKTGKKLPIGLPFQVSTVDFQRKKQQTEAIRLL